MVAERFRDRERVRRAQHQNGQHDRQNTPVDYLRLSEQLKALADPTRLKILELLPDTDRCEDVYNVSELAQEIAVPQPTISHHLKVLYNAGIVRSRKMCRDVYYWIDMESAGSVLAQFNLCLRKSATTPH